MNKKLKSIALLFLGVVSITSCNDDDSPTNEIPKVPATATEFAAIRTEALDKLKQSFTITQASGLVTLTSEKGVTINIDRDQLRKNGNPVTGPFNLDYIEIFDKGTMLAANKPTMGLTSDGKKNLLISGGEFYIQPTQDGVPLTTLTQINLIVPTALTDGLDDKMTLWIGNLEDPENLVWRNIAEPGANDGKGGVQGEGSNYYVYFGNFGWANVDRFYSDPRPKTTILVDAPEGYDNDNCAIYLSYDGEGQNALAKLDTYTDQGLFSEHYGQIPIGLACHIIFVTEDDGQWRYAVKGVTIAENQVYTFTLAETIVGTEAQLIAAINAIQ